ncbi:transmembrane protein, putative (macronuclear) [Tetrahymena thermophila SB210]|uniref:Transmembrane protein, putative n=1 Tax=Tetrahymena thermophila (strain SB210) TaxID=312017 RepID=X1W3P6_TETTS|nr:transmembrane protein, putative [Tetrahymena thermophila SB210]EDK31494.1 transmembrane protein, putative [Tetrahymena thermophila SB210]|eukprot:XP_001471437.1 transmembrane protein, putative [Tetrahymena thermophila SB210]
MQARILSLIKQLIQLQLIIDMKNKQFIRVQQYFFQKEYNKYKIIFNYSFIIIAQAIFFLQPEFLVFLFFLKPHFFTHLIYFSSFIHLIFLLFFNLIKNFQPLSALEQSQHFQQLLQTVFKQFKKSRLKDDYFPTKVCLLLLSFLNTL